MKNKLILFGLLASAVIAEAGIVYNDYSSSPLVADTGLSSSTTETLSYLYIGSSGSATTSNPGGNNVSFLAYRDRNAVILTTKIEEYVHFSSGVCLTGLNDGDSIGSSLNYSGGDILYQTIDGNPGDHTWTAGPAMYGFRISDGAGDYYYGWAEIYSELQTVQGSPSDNRAMVRISQVAISDSAGESITAGVIPEPATLGLFGLFGGGMYFIRRRFRI